MSEKSLWKALVKKGVKGYRLEGCCTKGVPDAVMCRNHDSIFIELKDWSVPKKHSLSIEQYNFLKEAGGLVLIKVDKKSIVLCKPSRNLCTCDKDYAMEVGHWLPLSKVDGTLLWEAALGVLLWKM